MKKRPKRESKELPEKDKYHYQIYTGGAMIEYARLSVTFHLEPSAQYPKYKIDYNRNKCQYQITAF